MAGERRRPRSLGVEFGVSEILSEISEFLSELSEFLSELSSHGAPVDGEGRVAPRQLDLPVRPLPLRHLQTHTHTHTHTCQPRLPANNRHLILNIYINITYVLHQICTHSQ